MHTKRVLISFLVLVLLTLFSAGSRAANPLSADEAFSFSATLSQKNEILLNWKIAPGYYLYQDRLKVTASPATKLRITYPQGELKHYDKSKALVYVNSLTVPVFVQPSIKSLAITYQGCSDRGFCYPPQEAKLSLDLHDGQLLINDHKLAPQTSLLNLVTNQEGVKTLLDTEQSVWVLFLFLGLGLLLAFTPCVLPMIPILTSIIVGQKHASLQRSFFLSCAYVLGSAITYSVAGLLAAYMGSSLQVWLQEPLVIGFVCLLFLFLAVSLLGLYDLRLPQGLHHRLVALSNKQTSGNYAGVFCMGMISTLVVSPCVTAPLVGVLLYIGQTGDLVFGASALFILGLGMGLPLILIGISAGRFLPKSGAWMDIIKKLFAMMMLAMAVWMLSRVVSATTTFILWELLSLIFIAAIVYYLPILKKRRVHVSFTVLTATLGLVLIFGLGAQNPLFHWMSNQQHKSHAFLVVNNLDDFNQQLLAAQASKKLVILDFYADWCTSCVDMDKKVFNHPQVKNVLSDYVVLRADLSQNNSNDEAMLRYFNVIAPPTVLFFDEKGNEVNARRIVGEVNAKQFLNHMGKS